MEESKKIKYSWTRDRKMIGTILLVVTVVLQIFAFLQVPVISSIHAYTIGMLLGYYNPFFYIFVAYKALVMIFGEKVKLPKWIKLTDLTYWLVTLSIIFIGTSLFFYQTKTGFTSIGLEPWKSFKVWFNDFTSETAWAPANTNGGVVGAFLYAFFAMISSGIGAIIISIASGAIVASILITGSFFGLYKTMLHKRKTELAKKEVTAEDEAKVDELMIRSAKEDDAKYEIPEEEIIEVKEQPIESNIEPKKESDEEELFPFEDPFA